MSDVILKTKFHIPALRTAHVTRSRLTKRLNQSGLHRLILIIAPAGFGKTSLLSEWVSTADQPIWLSLDEDDNNQARFLRYLIYAIRSVIPDFGSEVLELLATLHITQHDELLFILINALLSLPRGIKIIFDDYHVITNPQIHEAMNLLMAHLPDHIQFIIASREEPPLNLSILRGRAQLLEIDASHLRFTAIEVDQFLREVMHLELSNSDRIKLEMRTEGWITGLQLAALSLQIHEDKSTFLSDFTGANRYIADYLFEQVFRHQSREHQQFLLYTSTVEEICSELCDELIGTSGSQQMLENLERSRLFIIPLDDERKWYRYHHLFADLLRRHLETNDPDAVPNLHLRASQWYARQNRLDDAIRHCLLAGEFALAAEQIEEVFLQHDWIQHDMHRLLEWFNQLPGNIIQIHPKLILSHAWLLFEIFEDPWDKILIDLEHIEAWIFANNPTNYLENSERATLYAQVDLLYANHARFHKDHQQVIVLSKRALGRLPHDETYIRSGIMAHLASAYEALGNVIDAAGTYAESIEMCRTARNLDGLLFATAHLIDVYRITGRLSQAEQIYRQAQGSLGQRSGPDVGMIKIAMAGVYYERNQFQEAHIHLQEGLALCRPFSAWHETVVSGIVLLAKIFVAENRLEEAISLIDQITVENPLGMKHILLARVHLYLVSDNFSVAARWVKQIQVGDYDNMAYEDESELLMYVRILLAQTGLKATGHREVQVAKLLPEKINHLLDRLCTNAVKDGRLASVIEAKILFALFHNIRGNTKTAMTFLDEALQLAEPEHYIRSFADEGYLLYQLLVQYQTVPRSSSVSRDFLSAIRAAFPKSVQQRISVSNGLFDSLTESEFATLHLLASDLSINAIAAELSVAVSTIRTYTKRIYSKLDVHSRSEAVYRAKELNLI